MKKYILGMAVAASVAVTSCSSSKSSSLTYFQDITSQEEVVNQIAESNVRLYPSDELLISVTSAVPKASAIYNRPAENPDLMQNAGISTTPQQSTYIIDSKGNIDFPGIGKIHVEGMSVEELCDYITAKVSETVVDPSVKVSLVNFRVNVLGEVHKPSAITVRRTRYSILDALADAGDLTEFGERDKVLLIRQKGDKQERVMLNLNSSEVLTSPYFYLQPNDAIYIQPNSIKKENSKYNINNGYKLSVVSTIVSASSVIASLVIALTVK